MSLSRLMVSALLLLAAPALAAAQNPVAPRQSVVSVNPLAIILGLYGAEYERRMGRTTSLGVLGSHWSTDTESTFGHSDVSYTSFELKGRIYPNARIFQGFSFAAASGLVLLREEIWAFGESQRTSATAVSIGFELGYSWLLGEQNNFYVGTGIGAKRLGVVSGEVVDASLAYPTVRLSVGYAF
jgi:hypothetical protein